MDIKKIKEKVRDEIRAMFHEVYSGVQYPVVSSEKIDYFVEKALGIAETKLFYEMCKITRVEVIDKKGRQYVNMKCRAELSIQDQGRTMKVFIK